MELNLPRERLTALTANEAEFVEKVLKKETEWTSIPKDIQIMALRGWGTDKKDETVTNVKYIVEWRKKSKSDTMLQQLPSVDSDAYRFFHSWATRVSAKTDDFGHLICFDRVCDFNLDYLFTLADEDCLIYHTMQMEVLRQLKLNSSSLLKKRSVKHVYMLDLSGLSLSKHFTVRLKNLLEPLFKIEGTAYPDSLWSLWLLNTPMTFRVIWAAISPGLDAASKSKIRMLGGPNSYLPEMEKCGIPVASIPTLLGGQAEFCNYFEEFEKLAKKVKKE